MKLNTKTLYIVSTPIGNLDDMTIRAVEVLKKVDIIICEDTRHSIKLLNHFKIKKKLISYHKFNEKKQITPIIEHFNQGKILALISDAGTPTLSDPGSILLNEIIRRNLNIVPVPGVSAITSAMSISGFSDKFLFYGFLPKKEKELEKTIEPLAKYHFSLIFFIPASKIKFYLKKFKKYFFDRRILIAKEITKIHETFLRGTLGQIDISSLTLKGELTVVISEKPFKKEPLDTIKIINKAKKFLKKYSLKDTVDLIMETEPVSKKKIYQICLNLKNEKIN